MKKNLKFRIEAMSKEQLVGVIEQMCRVAEVEKLLKLIVSPTQTDVDRALRVFSACCDAYISNSCNDRDWNAMHEAAEPLYAAYKNADDRMCAYIIYGMHEAMEENGLIDSGDGENYYDLVGDLLGDMEGILKHAPELFTEEEFRKYSSVVALDD